ncbi:NACHT and WD repeat domain-containing protein [Actinomadura livida]|uniref:WD40 repeat protein n=1 Tax=Actinomadura livida TaxID=79909 RepID=A0A7W7N110_9ACTN|nr:MULTISPECIES: WD40 repeat domain-containing protein [Actinomadura]MBB4777457.1 WD40 repeat protein [Actinomadura catellatispora]
MRRRQGPVFPGYLMILLVALLGLALQVSPQTTQVVQAWALPVIVVCMLLIPLVLAWEKGQERRNLARPGWKGDRSPYPGLDAFTEDDDGVFFGRDGEIQELVERLRPGSEPRSIAVTGPSGVGKSSLLYAGLLPRLAQQRRWIVLPSMTPESDPFRCLAYCLADALGGAAEEIAEELRREPAALRRRVDELRRGRRNRSVLIVVDQAEELLTLTEDDQRGAFLGMLRDGLDADPKLWVVLVFRAEFLTTFLSGGSADMFRHPFTVTALDRAALRTVIREPAERAGIAFEPPELVAQMAEDTGGGTALPLLAYLLHELYLQVGRNGTITLADYRRTGGVDGALTRRADRLLGELEALDPAPPVLPTLLKFVKFTEGRPTRRRVAGRELDEAGRLVVDAFVRERLCTSGRDGEDAVFEVSHEALFSAWAPLRQTIALHAEVLRRIADLEQWAAEWDRYGRQEAYLLRGERLAAARKWVAEAEGLAAIEPLALEFVEISHRSDGAAIRRLADSVARQALTAFESDPERSLLLALAAYEDCAPTPLVRRALSAGYAVARLRGVLHGHEDRVWSVAWSPDGSRLATASADHSVRVWEDGAEVAVLRGHEAMVSAVAWSPDGSRLASASDDGTVRIWDVASRARVAVLRGHGAMVWSADWSPDGTRVVSASRDGDVRIWSVADGASETLRGHEGWVRNAAWSPDGSRIASASDDRTIRIWDADTGRELAVLRGHEDTVRMVAWSPDSARLAGASYDRTARVWDVSTGESALVARGHADLVWSVAWSPDGTRLATASYDRTIRLWSAEDGTELVVLRGHGDNVRAAVFSPDGARLASGSDDRTVRLWDAECAAETSVLRGHTRAVAALDWSAGGLLASGSYDRTVRIWAGDEPVVLRGHADEVWDVAWSPDGSRVGTASRDRTVRIWDAAGGEEAVLRDHGDWVRAVAWSPDGTRLASASDDRTVRVHRTDGAEPLVLRGHEDTVRAVAWSPDGERLASGSYDRTVQVWEARTGMRLMRLHVPQGAVRSLVWSPDGGRLAAVSNDRDVQVWDAAEGVETAVLHGHDGWVWSIAWSPDGRMVATVSADRTVRLWDPAAGEELCVAAVHSDEVWDVAWSPDGTRIATASGDRTVRIWEVVTDGAALVARARSRVFRRLTPDERHALMIPAPRPSADGARNAQRPDRANR